jgi:hypothetical protein
VLVWLVGAENMEVYVENPCYFMIICDEIELTKDEILGTIDALVVCFDTEIPVEIRLI